MAPDNGFSPDIDDREQQRLHALRRYSILNAEADPNLDALTRTASRLFHAPIIIVSVVDEHRQWFKSRVGTDMTETPRCGSFCDVGVTLSEPLIVLDAKTDERFKDSPYVTGDPYVRFYAGGQIKDGAGEILGVFCVIDTEARESFPDTQLEVLRAFADEAAAVLTAPTERLTEANPPSNTAHRFFDLFVRDLPVAAAMVDRDFRYLAVSDSWYDMFQAETDDLIGESHLNITPGLSSERKNFFQSVVEDGAIETGAEMVCRQHNGEKVWFRCDTRPWFEDDGTIGGMMMYRSIIDSEIEMRSTIALQQKRHKEIYNQTPAMLLTMSPHGSITQVSEFFLSKVNRARSDVLGSNATAFMTENSAAHMVGALRVRLFENGSVTDEPIDLLTNDGEVLHTVLSATAERDAHGDIIQVNCLFFDVGELRALEQKLEKSEQVYEDLYNRSPIMLHSIDPSGNIDNVSGFWLQTLGYTASEVIGRPLWDFMTDECACRACDNDFPVFLETGRAENIPYTLVTKNGQPVDVRLTAVARFGDNGELINATAVMKDETAEKKSLQKANRSQQLFEAFFYTVPAHMYVKSRESEYLLYNKFFADAFNMPETSEPVKAIDITTPETAAELEAIDKEVIETNAYVHRKVAVVDKQDVERHLDIRKFPIHDESGETALIGGVTIDMTEQVVMEQGLRQAQKMEAVGNLTGGVAHDFNNILAIVLGNLELLQRHIEPESKQYERLIDALKATNRGADLTKQLLAFSRRQSLEPSNIDVNETLRDLNKMISRTLSEAVSIELILSDDVPAAFIDEGQLQNCVLNLSINARDAMPDGGTLQIETEAVSIENDALAGLDGLTPGHYVTISLTDTGHGMTHDVRDRVFEPFFTTKGVGKGTGLGLAMVYGFIKQSGGHVTIYSEVDRGTNVKLYLPVAGGNADAAEEPSYAPEMNVSGRILVVEDDGGVRNIVEAMLEDLGYDTVAAETGVEALSILEKDQAFDLVFSDVIMPGGITGVDLGRTIAQRYASLPVLLSSGYPRNAVKTDFPVHILQKPYKQEQLAAEIAKAMAPGDDGRDQPAPSQAGAVDEPSVAGNLP